MKIIIPILFCVLINHLFAQDIIRTMSVEERQREYLVHLPQHYTKEHTYPVLLALHGGGGNYVRTVHTFHLNPLADSNGCNVVYPNAIAKCWSIPGFASRVKGYDSTVNDVRFISILIDSVITNFHGDPKAVFVTGMSRGGEMAYYLGCKLNDKIRGIIPVCASIPVGFLPTYSFQKPMAVLMVNGTADPLIRYEGGYGSLIAKRRRTIGFDLVATADLFNHMKQINGCKSNDINTKMPDTYPEDNCDEIRYVNNSGKALVSLIKVNKGGHVWPGGEQYLPKMVVGSSCLDFNMETEVFDFMKAVLGGW